MGSDFYLQGSFIRIDFRERFGHIEVNVVQIQFPLFNPASHLNALVALLPPLGPGVEFLMRRFGDTTGKGASLLQDRVVLIQRFDNRPGNSVRSPD